MSTAEVATSACAFGDCVFSCPLCRNALRSRGDSLECENCEGDYGIIDGIPILRPGTSGHTYEQAAFYDEKIDELYEIERPNGQPRFHAWLLSVKFRKGTSKIGASIRGKPVLVVCGGSGLDAEFLAEAGAQVITSDVSLGAALRARERARRHGFAVTSIVADVERLPFGDAAVELVYVHDGLHHLEDPAKGLQEMMRVARTALSINEPARAAATTLAVRFSLAERQEEAGNEVWRFTQRYLANELRSRGFLLLTSRRYAMLYRHKPRLPTRLLSWPGLFQLGKVGFVGANLLFGRWGNKLAVQAVRR